MQYLFLILAIVAIAVWWLGFRERSKNSVTPKIQSSISERDLILLQADFERRLENDYDLPDGIRGRDAYIYWNIMRIWFDQLIAANRFNDEYSKKLRRDWCEYIQLLSRSKTASFLALEENNDAKTQIYGREAESGLRSIEVIQNAFAAAIGPEAVEVLREIRSRDADAFDRSGRRPMAPMGYHYFPVSISPYAEECKPKASHKITL